MCTLWVAVNALEVCVQNQLLVRVHLEVAQQYLLALAIDFQVEDRRVEGFFLQRVYSALPSRAIMTGASVPP